eukprot:763012-Hanusia_phi.AAC.1
MAGGPGGRLLVLLQLLLGWFVEADDVSPLVNHLWPLLLSSQPAVRLRNSAGNFLSLKCNQASFGAKEGNESAVFVASMYGKAKDMCVLRLIKTRSEKTNDLYLAVKKNETACSLVLQMEEQGLNISFQQGSPWILCALKNGPDSLQYLRSDRSGKIDVSPRLDSCSRIFVEVLESSLSSMSSSSQVEHGNWLSPLEASLWVLKQMNENVVLHFKHVVLDQPIEFCHNGYLVQSSLAKLNQRLQSAQKRTKTLERETPQETSDSSLTNRMKQLNLGKKDATQQATHQETRGVSQQASGAAASRADNSKGSKKSAKVSYKKRVKQMLAEEAKAEKAKADKKREEKKKKGKLAGEKSKPLADLPDPKDISHSGAGESLVESDTSSSMAKSRQGGAGGAGAIGQASSSMKCSGCGGVLKSEMVAGDKVKKSGCEEMM